MLLVDGGYLEDGIYHYYIQDHLGNNRVVAKADGAVVQLTHYYPFGMSFAESLNTDKQPYKYNGKELDAANGLNWYDYKARQLELGTTRFITIDPMTEKYYSWSPYAYCLNNPLLLVDSNGMWPSLSSIRQQVSSVVSFGISAVSGAVSAIVDNMAGGTTTIRETSPYSNGKAYNIGQDIGDVVSLFGGAFEMGQGATNALVGVLATPETAGVSLTLAAEGVTEVAHGAIMSFSAGKNLGTQKGRVSEKESNGNNTSTGNPEYKKPKSGSGKEKANNPPSWVKGKRPFKGESGKDFAKRMMEEKYGKNADYNTGADSEYNKIKKYGDRAFE